MDVKTKHPSITAARQDEWTLIRAAMDGEETVKMAGEIFLPKPSGFKALKDDGVEAYNAYRKRAQFPEILAPSVSAMVGIIHEREIGIEIPASLEYLHENIDGLGLTLDAFHRRITRALLTIGRYGVLADAPEGGGEPYLVGYAGDAVINWDRNFWVLDESGPVRNGFAWENVEKFRVLELIDGRYVQTVYDGKTNIGVPVDVRASGGRPLDRIPFDVASALDVSAVLHPPPLIGVARAAKAIYQLSADYRWQLYMSGQETLVAINGEAPKMVGAGVVHSMIGAEGITPDLKYVSPSCVGIEAHKIAMEDNRTAAMQAGARLLDVQQEQTQESGEARRLRFASETATLISIAQCSCALLERGLRNVAALKGAPEDGIVVAPPAELLDRTMTPAEAEALMRLWQGGGIAYETFYENLQRGGIASSERSFEEEQALLDERVNDAQI